MNRLGFCVELHLLLDILYSPCSFLLDIIGHLDQLRNRIMCFYLVIGYCNVPIDLNVLIFLVEYADLVMMVRVHRIDLVLVYLFRAFMVHHHHWYHLLTRFLIFA